jgi:hypothetical protein
VSKPEDKTALEYLYATQPRAVIDRVEALRGPL